MEVIELAGSLTLLGIALVALLIFSLLFAALIAFSMGLECLARLYKRIASAMRLRGS